MEYYKFLVCVLVTVSISFTSILCTQDGCREHVTNNSVVYKTECIGVNVTAIPKAIPSDISELLVHQSALTFIVRTDLENLTSLQTFRVEDSQLETIEAGVFDHLFLTLSNISLKGNRLNRLPYGLFTKLNRLKFLNLNHNFLSTLDDVLVGLETLVELEVRTNHLVSLETRDMSQLMSIEMIDVSMNLLQAVNFSQLQSLKVLKIGGNFLQAVDGAFESLTNLRKLTLTNNNIYNLSLDIFEDLTELTHVDLRNNKLTHLQANLFQHSKQLSHILLSANPLVSIDGALYTNIHIHALDLCNCSFQRLPHYPPPSLQTIQLSFNNISRINEEDARHYPQLNTLVLKYNLLEHVESGAMSTMSKLKRAIFNHNHLQSFPEVFSVGIIEIEVDNNRISDISAVAFVNGTELKSLSLRNNSIAYMRPDALTNVDNIERLYLDHNPIRELNSTTFPKATGLEYLHINNLHLENITEDCFLGLEPLKHLYMSFVKVNDSHIEGQPFTAISGLNTLMLQASPAIVSHLLSSAGLTFENLTEVNLMDNGLETLDMSVMDLFPSVKRMFLRGNRFECTESIMWIPNTYLYDQSMFPGFDRIECHSPKHLAGRHITNISFPEVSSQKVTDFSNVHYQTTSSVYDMYYYYLNTDGPSVDHNLETVYPQGTELVPDYITSDPDSPYYSDVETATPEYETTTTTTKTTTTQDPTHMPDTPNTNQTAKPKATESGSRLLRDVGIAAGTSMVVVLIILSASFVVYKCCLQRHSRSPHTDQIASADQDVTITVLMTKKDKPEQKIHRKLSRTERGSTTSHASGDITNQIDPSMKVYTLDTDA